MATPDERLTTLENKMVIVQGEISGIKDRLDILEDRQLILYSQTSKLEEKVRYVLRYLKRDAMDPLEPEPEE